MPITSAERKNLLPRCSHLKPVVIVGNAGVTDAVLAELDQALLAHELVKVRVNAGDRTERRSMTERLAAATGADLVQAIGHVIVLFRPSPD